MTMPILQDWIGGHCGLMVNTEPEILSKLCKDGYLFATILYKYGVINRDQLALIDVTDDPELIRNNLDYLRIWFKLININLDTVYDENSENSEIWKVFYLLYLYLNDNNVVRILSEKLTRQQKIYEPISRFVVEKTEIKPEPPFINKRISTYFEKTRGVAIWLKYRTQALQQQLQARREMYLNLLESKCRSNNDLLGAPHKSFCHLVQPSCNLIATTHSLTRLLYEGTVDDTKFEPSEQDAKDFTDAVKKKHHLKEKEALSITYALKTIVIKLYAQLDNDFTEQLNQHVVSTIWKQSRYEKQIMERMYEVFRHKNVIGENSRNLLNMVSEKKQGMDVFERACEKEQRSVLSDLHVIEIHRDMERCERLSVVVKRLDSTRNFKFCAEILDLLVDLTIRYANYKEQYDQEPWPTVFRQWKYLLIKNMPIFDVVAKTEDIVTYNPHKDTAKQECKFKSEVMRQNAIDDMTLMNYIEQTNNSNSESIMISKNIFSHIITMLLNSKYPQLEMPSISDIPDVAHRIVLNDMCDYTILPMLRYYLKDYNIRVIQLDEAINYCIACYISEVPLEDEGKIVEETTAKTFEDLVQKQSEGFMRCFQNSSMRKCENYNPIPIVESSCELLNESGHYDSEVQTTSVQGNLSNISEAAKLGKIAHNTLNLGGEIDPVYTIHMLLEYLKTFRNINGWVLINFPETSLQVSIFEELFTGKSVPPQLLKPERSHTIEHLRDLDLRDLDVTPPLDPNKKHRKSLFFKVDMRNYPKYYEPYINKYIVMRQHDEDICRKTMVTCSQNFYVNNTTSYVVSYKYMSLEVIQILSNVIAKSGELYDGCTRCQHNVLVTQIGTPREKSKKTFDFLEDPAEAAPDESSGKQKKNAKKKPKKTEKVVVKYASKCTQLPEQEYQTKPVPPKIGEEDWCYVSISFPKQLQDMLASFWESVEETFEVSFKELCFIHRVHINAQVPYGNFFKAYIFHLIHRPDNKQVLLQAFQKEYNDFPIDIRDDIEFQAEMHYRIKELTKTLTDIADSKKAELEVERQNFTGDDWFGTQVCEFLNIYTTYFQIELDRFLSTFQFITDYYMCVITKEPWEHVFEKASLKLISTGKKGETLQIAAYVRRCLLLDIPQLETNLLTEFVLNQYQATLKIAAKAKDTADSVIQKFSSSALVGKKKATSTKASKKSDKTAKLKVTDSEVLQQGEAIVDEWTYAVNGVYARVLFNLNSLKEEHLKEVQNLLSYHVQTNRFIHDEIADCWTRETESINRAFETVGFNIQQQMPIREMLVLDEDMFFMHPQIIMFDDPLPLPEPPTEERQHQFVFTIKQLSYITDLFNRIAPEDFIPSIKFTHVLQDLITYDTEDESFGLIPKQWAKLSQTFASLLRYKIYGEVDCVYWRDFIVYNVNVPAPTERDILQISREFHKCDPNDTSAVLMHQFMSIKFWFDDLIIRGSSTPMVVKQIKTLLAKLYAVTEDSVNYNKLLLDFCKDEEPLLGAVKALELHTGCYVCYNFAEGQEYKHALLAEARRSTSNTPSDQMSITISKSQDSPDDTSEEIDEVNKEEENEEGEEEEEEEEEIEKEVEVQRMYECKLEEEEPIEQFEKIYSVPREVVIKVITAALPWYVVIETLDHKNLTRIIEKIYRDLKCPELNNKVFIHEVLHNIRFKAILKSTKKFLYQNPMSFGLHLKDFV